MLKPDIKKLPSTLKWAPSQPHPSGVWRTQIILISRLLFETLQLWTKVQRSFCYSLNVTVWSLVQNQTLKPRLLLFLKQVPGIFCLEGGRGVFKAASLKNCNQCQEKNPSTFQEIPNVKYCLVLAFQSVLERTPEQQSPPARPGPRPAKADQCQHRCFNVHNIYKPDTCRQFICNF